jgi:hypothetical protein
MINFKEKKFDENTFMGGWYMPENVCDDLIVYFKNNKNTTHKGLIGTNRKVVPNKKDSNDLTIKINNVPPVVHNYLTNLQLMMGLYEKKYPELNEHKKWGVVENFNLQHYEKGGGFKCWHSERMWGENRLLVFMTYLNDVKDGGTQFKYQKVTVKAKKGLTLIWPSDWTHTHKGQISDTTEKYIITGWLGFFNE